MNYLIFGVIGLLSFPLQAKEAPASAPEVDLDTMIGFEASGFNMGLPFVEMQPYGDGWFIDQTPEHYVSLSAFHMDITEVTVADFATFLNMSGGDAYYHPHQPIIKKEMQYKPIKDRVEEPIQQVTWYAADAYCRWAGKRLPTEAEHKYAAGGVEERGYAWGDSGATFGRGPPRWLQYARKFPQFLSLPGLPQLSSKNSAQTARSWLRLPPFFNSLPCLNLQRSDQNSVVKSSDTTIS